MAFLTNQSRRIRKSWYSGEGPEQGFRRCFADRLNQCLVSCVTQAKEIVLCKGFAILKQRCFLTFLLKNIRVAYYNWVKYVPSVVKYFESYFEDGFTLSFKFSFCFFKSCFCLRTVFLF